MHTGDAGYLDEDNVLFFVQRIKRMIIVSGYNVFPAHIEEILMKHEKIKNCCVIGIPHPYKIQVPKAFIVLNEGIEPQEIATEIARTSMTANTQEGMKKMNFITKLISKMKRKDRKKQIEKDQKNQSQQMQQELGGFQKVYTIQNDNQKNL